MTSRDRILKVLDGEIPDRVPVTLFILDEGHFLTQIYPNLDIKDYIGNKYKVIDLQRKLGTDIHLRLSGGCSPKWITIGGFNTKTQTKCWSIKEETINIRGKSQVISTKVKTPKGELYQEFTISEIFPGVLNYVCTKKPVNTKKDLEILKEYEPPIEENYPGYIKNLVSKVVDYLGDDGITSIWISGGFNHSSRLINLETIYMLYLIDKDFYSQLMDYSFNRMKPLIEAITATDIDMICIGGNVAGGFLGAKIFEEYILPYEKRLISFIKNKGKKVLYHNCGQIMNLLESYKKLGADTIESFAPPPLGDGDLVRAKELSEGKYTIIGNIDQINIIKEGNSDVITEKVKEALNGGKEGGKFILQPSDFLEKDTPFENVKAYVEAGIKYGKY